MKPSAEHCSICNKCFQNKKSLTNHIRWHNLPKYKDFQKSYSDKSKIFTDKTKFKKGHKLWDNCLIKQKMASNLLGIKNPNYIDGRSNTDWFKYKLILSGGKLILEHRYLMEKIIGRKLNKREIVHHIDGNPKNNSLNNLQLFRNNAEHIKFHRVNKH